MSERKKLKMVSSTTASVATPAAPSVAPDPEVHAVAKRRQFSAAYKLAVLEEADRCSSPGAIGALLRREALYSSHLTVWRREREAGALAALGARRGRKAKLSAEQRRIAELQSHCARLERELEQARTIIEVQKKLCTLLGLPTAASSESNGSESSARWPNWCRAWRPGERCVRWMRHLRPGIDVVAPRAHNVSRARARRRRLRFRTASASASSIR